MADPTPTEIIGAMSLVSMNPAAVVNEVKRLLEDCLPGAIDMFNTNNGTSVPKPAGIRKAPNELKSTDIDSILMEDPTVSTEWVSGDDFKNVVRLEMHCVNKKIVSDAGIDSAWARVGIIQALLWFSLGKGLTPGNKVIWSVLKSEGAQGLPAKYAEYSGATIVFTAVQEPGNNGY